MNEFDPCDACGTRSFVFVDLPSGLTLSYCGHHYDKYRAGLEEVATQIEDLRHLIPV